MLTSVTTFIGLTLSGPIFLILWPVLFGEAPRYVLLTVAAMIEKKIKGIKRSKEDGPLTFEPYSAIIVGHNAADGLMNSIATLHEQVVPPSEIIIVSDGSDDESQKIVNELLRTGKIAAAHHVGSRNGKSAALNLGASTAQYDYLLFIDSDTTLNRDTVELMFFTMKDHSVGAVSANVIPRGRALTLMQMIQKIEYGITLSLGRLVLDKLNMVSCVSGACGLYRRAAIESVEGHNAGSGEDLDITLRIRQAGWRIRFANEAIASTAVPKTLKQFTNQRLRWERDSVGIRLNRQREVLLLGRGSCNWREIFHMAEYLLFYILPVLLMPIYVFWLYSYDALFASSVLITIFLCNATLDLLLVLIAQALGLSQLRFVEFLCVPAYSFFALTFYRPLRLFSVLSEMCFQASSMDDFVPQRVRKTLEN